MKLKSKQPSNFLTIIPMKKLALLTLTSLLLASCQIGGEQEPIKIGLITPLTGEVASIGADVLHGAQMMLEEINSAGGINGREVKLIAEDGRCAGADAAAAAQKLINVDRVVAIHGAGCSSESLAATPIAEAAGVVIVSPSSSSPDLTHAGEFFFRTYPSDDLKTTAMTQYFKEEELKKVAMISENTDFCEAFRASLKRKFGEENFVFDEVVEPNTKDFRTLLARLQEFDFDVFFLNAQTPVVGSAMLQQSREFGMEQLAIGSDVMDGKVVIELTQEAAEGFQVINVPTVADESEFGQKFIAKYGLPQSNMAWGAYGYDTLGVIAEAIAAAGTEGAAIRDHLNNLEVYNAVVGDISFDENGDVVGIPYALREVQNGEFVKLKDIVVE